MYKAKRNLRYKHETILKDSILDYLPKGLEEHFDVISNKKETEVRGKKVETASLKKRRKK